MGRTPFDNNLVTPTPGRDHNQYGLVVWMAGGDVKPGLTFGETDDFSVRAANEEIPLSVPIPSKSSASAPRER